MLHGITVACPPALRISAAASSHTGALRDDTTTLAPANARCIAIALPIPLLDPVTTATLPVRSKSGDGMQFPSEILRSLLGIVVAVEEARIGIEAQARPGRHLERRLPARMAEAVGIQRIVGLDGGEPALLFRHRQH